MKLFIVILANLLALVSSQGKLGAWVDHVDLCQPVLRDATHQAMKMAHDTAQELLMLESARSQVVAGTKYELTAYSRDTEAGLNMKCIYELYDVPGLPDSDRYELNRFTCVDAKPLENDNC